MTRHRWTAEDDQVIEDLVGEHRTDYIARRLGLSVGQVNNRIAVLGLSRRREGGMRWVIPESILPRLVEGRRRWTDDDAEHRRQVRMYERLQARGTLRALQRARPRRRKAA